MATVCTTWVRFSAGTVIFLFLGCL